MLSRGHQAHKIPQLGGKWSFIPSCTGPWILDLPSRIRASLDEVTEHIPQSRAPPPAGPTQALLSTVPNLAKPGYAPGECNLNQCPVTQTLLGWPAESHRRKMGRALKRLKSEISTRSLATTDPRLFFPRQPIRTLRSAIRESVYVVRIDFVKLHAKIMQSMGAFE